MAVSPREAFLGEAEEVAVEDAVGRDLVRVDRRLPAGHPGAAARRADHGSDDRRYLRELVATGARLHGASDPRFERVHVLVER